jgi:membrane protease subunit HflK
LRELLASRSIDDTLTTARGSIEQAARVDLQHRLDTAGIPLRTISVNVLDLHPPDAAVQAFRDISSAGEDRETRIHKASGKADAALPTARGQAATMLASAESDRIENIARAEGVSTAFAVQAQVARQSGSAVRSMLRWDALDRLFFGKRLVLIPHQVAREFMDLPPAQTGGFF